MASPWQFLSSFFLTALVSIASAKPVIGEDAMQRKVAIFGGGCFWCMEPPFDNTAGVVETIVGYTGGQVENPSYEEVSSGRTGHWEAVRVTYDPEKVSYRALLEVFWRNIDPTQDDGQFADRGQHYRTVIFYLDDAQRQEAERSKSELAKSGKFSDPIVTEILPARPFYPAEEAHQNYYQKEKEHYDMYKRGSGRAGFLERTWKE